MHFKGRYFSQGSSKQRTGLGSIGTAVTGAAFFNDWSDPNGKVAMSFEVSNPNNPFEHLATIIKVPSSNLHSGIIVDIHFQNRHLVCRHEAWTPALVTLQEGDPITTMPISTAPMPGG